MFSVVLRNIFFTEIWNVGVNWNKILRRGPYLGQFPKFENAKCMQNKRNQSDNPNLNNETFPWRYWRASETILKWWKWSCTIWSIAECGNKLETLIRKIFRSSNQAKTVLNQCSLDSYPTYHKFEISIICGSNCAIQITSMIETAA